MMADSPRSGLARNPNEKCAADGSLPRRLGPRTPLQDRTGASRRRCGFSEPLRQSKTFNMLMNNHIDGTLKQGWSSFSGFAFFLAFFFFSLFHAFRAFFFFFSISVCVCPLVFWIFGFICFLLLKLSFVSFLVTLKHKWCSVQLLHSDT